MDGLLVVDKPAGPTSHEVVARVRRALGERRIGHTGTLDPAATGVLPLVLGRATRLARFLSASDKSYDAVLRLGLATDTQDAQGAAIGPRHDGPLPSREAIDRALDSCRGTFMQQPPAYSAKKVAGERSYRAARRAEREGTALLARPAPVSVTARMIEIVNVDGDCVTLHVDCSAGFYVRTLAHDLGEQLGVGAHLLTLRRTRSGDVTLDQALALDAIERDPARGVRAVVPLSGMLPGLSSVTLTSEGVRHAVHGRDIGPADVEKGEKGEKGDGSRFRDGEEVDGNRPRPVAKMTPVPFFVRLVDPAGELVAIATPAGASGLLHPTVVLM